MKVYPLEVERSRAKVEGAFLAVRGGVMARTRMQWSMPKSRIPRLVGLVAVWAAAMTVPPPTFAQAEGSAPFAAANTSAEEVDRFLDDLRGALAREDRAAVAAMTTLPLWGWDGHHYVQIESEEQFAEAFDRIFDSALRATIGHATSASALVKPPAVTFDNSRFLLLHYAIDGLLRIGIVNRPVPAGGAAEPPATP